MPAARPCGALIKRGPRICFRPLGHGGRHLSPEGAAALAAYPRQSSGYRLQLTAAQREDRAIRMRAIDAAKIAAWTPGTACKWGHGPEWRPDPTKACRGCNRRKRLERYGMTEAEYEGLYTLQQGMCAICRRPLGPVGAVGPEGWSVGARIEIDHEHVRGVRPGLATRPTVRGLLCGGRWAGCNRKLGHFNAGWLRAAADYLDAPPAAAYLAHPPAFSVVESTHADP